MVYLAPSLDYTPDVVTLLSAAKMTAELVLTAIAIVMAMRSLRHREASRQGP